MIRIRDYKNSEHLFSFWRNRDQEIDVVVSNGHGPLLGIECKSGKSEIRHTAIRQFQQQFPKVPIIVASLKDQRVKKIDFIDVLPWKQALDYYQGI